MFKEIGDFQTAMKELERTVSELQRAPMEASASGVCTDAENSARIAAAWALLSWMSIRAIAKATREAGV